MKKKIFVMLAAMAMLLSLFGCGKGEQTDQPAGPQHTVTITLDCEENLLFSRYDVDVYVDDERIGTLEHGGSQAYQVETGEGSHILKVTKEGDSRVDGSAGFSVSADTELHYLLTCSRDQIKVTDLSETGSAGEDEKEEAEDIEDKEDTADTANTADTVSLEATLEKTFPQENARRTAVVAVTNFMATDIFSDDGLTEDPEKFHSYTDVSGDYMTIYSDGTWSAVDDHTWHVEDLVLEMPLYGSHCKVALDVSFDGQNYVVTSGTVKIAALEYLDSDDPTKIGEEELSDPETHPCLVVSPAMIEGERDLSAAAAKNDTNGELSGIKAEEGNEIPKEQMRSSAPAVSSTEPSGESVSNDEQSSDSSQYTDSSAESNDSGEIVYWVPSGEVYHSTDNCPTLSRSKTIYSGTIAQSGKSRPCKVCY